jgi:hypothetical protein
MRKILPVIFLLGSVHGITQNKLLDKGDIKLPGLPDLTQFDQPLVGRFICLSVSLQKPKKPVWVVDGVLKDEPLKDMDPNSIEMVWVLKEGTENSISYHGLRNDVIVIQTCPKRAYKSKTQKVKKITPAFKLLNVYPNPVSPGKLVTVKLQPGKNNFKVRLVSSGGNTLLVTKVQVTNSLTIMPDPRWLPGIYFIQYLDENNSLLDTKPVIIQ